MMVNDHQKPNSLWERLGKRRWYVICLTCMIPITLFGLFQTTLLVSYFASHAFQRPEVIRTWIDEAIPYSDINNEALRESEIRVEQRAQQVFDSLHQEWDVAPNLPKGFTPYEVRRQVQYTDLGQISSVLYFVDYRFGCDCPEALDQFYLIRMVIDPFSGTAIVAGDGIRPWKGYIPVFKPTIG